VGSHGPISTSRLGLTLFMKTYLGHEPWIKDPALVPLPWRQPEIPSRLKIGVMWNDGVVTPHPPVRRALRQVTSALRQFGTLFDVVDWVPFEHDRCWNISMALYFEDGGRAIRRVLEQG
jgi:Asp-tRNA(Asn)/Glu-tRNA(Gln) amidotransferase A subunit family amidase